MGNVLWCLTFLILEIWISSFFNEQLNELLIANCCRVVKRSHVLKSCWHYVCSMLNENLSDVIMPVICWFVKRRPTWNYILVLCKSKLKIVLPAKSVTFGFVPCSRSFLVKSKSPFLAAICNGVSPLSLRSLARLLWLLGLLGSSTIQ